MAAHGRRGPYAASRQVIDMPKIDGRNAVVPFAPHSSTGAAPQEGKAEPARRAQPDASLQALAKRSKPSVEAATGKTGTPAAPPPRATLPKATGAPRPHAHATDDAGRTARDDAARGVADAAPPPVHEHADTPPERSHAAQQPEHAGGHAAHAPDHDAQAAAAKTHHDRLRRFSDFQRRLAEHKSNVLVKLVGG